MKKTLYRGMIGMLNARSLGRLLHKMSRTSFSRRLIPLYVKIFNIQTDELDQQLKEFPSLEAFFIRRLKSGSRSFHGRDIASPVDAKLEQFGEVDDTLIKVKGISYSIEDLLQDDEMIARYRHGLFLVLYLSPKDYHRIHAPTDATIGKQYELGGKSFPVNQMGLTLGKSPLSTNYRIVSELKQEDGMFLALVKVGAMWVNTIELTHPASQVKKGEEIGFFRFGSTVVLLFEKDKVHLHPNLKEQATIKAGETVASELLPPLTTLTGCLKWGLLG
ncbi:archaetidylserine decarboxylase [Bacillus sp. RAR_GA_16]|uniref:archaetidylserine decarboxylase n=1 Tax=Bacillus sp. RAR_GA_16 TaxID=2876774 RepID=UPI001CCF950A|nr:archaetidylserine decarboxylase [Bacillus sp. RAR_GA_16]MCA0173830.1 archaetidylserine decarboxylase [Bacillus sp. RAR_GA_16]